MSSITPQKVYESVSNYNFGSCDKKSKCCKKYKKKGKTNCSRCPKL